MEGQGNGIFVFPRKGLGLEGTEVIPGKLAALLFVTRAGGKGRGTNDPNRAGLVVSQDEALKPHSQLFRASTRPRHPKRDTLPDSIAPHGYSISAFPMEDPPKNHSMATPVLGPFGALEGWHLHSQASPFSELSLGRRGEPRSLWAGRLLIHVGSSGRDRGWCVPILLSMYSSPGRASRECGPVSTTQG